MFYIPDLEEYKDTRGLYMEPEKLPGPATDSLDKLSEMLANPYEAVKDWQIITEMPKSSFVRMMTAMYQREL